MRKLLVWLEVFIKPQRSEGGGWTAQVRNAEKAVPPGRFQHLSVPWRTLDRRVQLFFS